MSNNKSIGDRFKEYEDAYRPYLPRRLPVIIRVDGKAFHTLTKRLDRPYDVGFQEVMTHTAIRMCELIQNCRMAYLQSDEISLLLVNYAKLETEPWLANNLAKMLSISASIATAHFNIIVSFHPTVKDTVRSLGYFDSRIFILPAAEVCNYFIWRQQDATRNAIQLAAQAQFSHKSLQNLDCKRLQEKLFQEAQVNFNDYPVPFKRGIVVRPVKKVLPMPRTAIPLGSLGEVERTVWEPDLGIPIFTKDRAYVEQWLPEYSEYAKCSKCNMEIEIITHKIDREKIICSSCQEE